MVEVIETVTVAAAAAAAAAVVSTSGLYCKILSLKVKGWAYCSVRKQCFLNMLNL